MTLQIRYLASLAEVTGRAQEELEIETSADLEGLWRLLVAKYPALGDLGYRPMVACDLEYSSWNRRLHRVREVALLPPVSGG